MSVPRVSRLLLASTVLAGLTIPAVLSAQAFGLNEIGSCAIARGYATTATPCRDASTIFWNPAGATRIDGWTASLGVASVALSASFHQDTTGRIFNANPPTRAVPSAFVNYHKTGSQLAYGIGFYVPYGLTSQWPNNFPGRFEATKASLETYYIQPNIAFQIDSNWSVGGGPIYGHSSVELIQALDLSVQRTPAGATFGQLGVPLFTQFGTARLKGDASAWGAQIGVWGRINPQWNVGIRFLSPLKFTYDNADATFTQVQTGLLLGADLSATLRQGTPIDALVAPQFTMGGALVSQKVSTNIDHPAQIQGGVSYTGVKNWLLEADYAWVNWSAFDKLPVTFKGPAPSDTLVENYKNTSSIKLGAEYTPMEHWRLRAGFAAATSAAPAQTVTPLLPEQNRFYWNFGIGVPLGKDFGVDGTYAHVSTNGARGRIIERTSPTQPADLNSGVYSLSANIFSITFKANF